MGIATTVGKLEGLDVGTLSLGEISLALRDLRRVEGFLAGLKTRLVQRADELAQDGSGVPAEELLGRDRTASRRESQKAANRAKALNELPEMSKQMSKGRIGTEHADAVTVAAAKLKDEERARLFALDEELAQAAASQSPESFRRFVQRRVDELAADDRERREARQREAATLTKGINRQTGMYWIRAELPPEAGRKVFRAIDQDVTQLRKRPEHEGRRVDQVASDAIVGLTTGGRGSGSAGPSDALLLIDLETIRHGLHERSICELGDGTEISVEAARRLACDANLIPVVLNGEGMPLDVGRGQRLATPDQRAALRSMHRTCAVDGCDAPFDMCEIHHLTEWFDDDGPTDLDNLLPTCPHHHHLAHEGGWRFELDPATRELTVWLPDGSLHSRCTPDLVAERTAGRAA